MNVQVPFQDKITIKIWDQFFKNLDRKMKALRPDQKKELKLEIQDHLLASFQMEKAKDEAERLLNAIDLLGDPEEFIRPLLADKLLTRAAKTLSPKAAFKGLYYHIFGGVKGLVLSFFFGIGYVIVFILAVMALLKPFFPKNVGVLIQEEGGLVVGILANSKNVKIDVFGYWIIPLGLILAVILYIALTKLLRLLRIKHNV